MAEASQHFKTSCDNCCIYGWKQPSDENTLLRCSKCKFVLYCSEECQQEHWVKVHRNHCKYLAKEKEKRKSRHDPASCPGCIKQAEVGLAEISKADSPYLGCPWTMDNAPLLPKPDHQRDVGGDEAAFPLPFKLGEMAGQWQTKAEHTVSIMNKLLHKMNLTKHPAYTRNPEAINLMTKLVNKMRQYFWLSYIHVVPTSGLHRAIRASINAAVIEILKQVRDISKDLSAQKDQTLYRPWDTFRLFLNILSQYRYDAVRQDVVRLGLPGMSEEDKQLMVTSDKFKDTWSKVLASMDGILVPYTDLLKILCDSDLHKFCSGCSQNIVVSDVGYGYAYCKVPSIFQGYTQAFLCGGVECYNKVATRDGQIGLACMKTFFAAKENICDYCFQVSKGKVHRCTRCLTKYYCGEECRNKDWWEVHKEVCKEGQERKVKGGQEERKEKGNESVEKYVKHLKALNINSE